MENLPKSEYRGFEYCWDYDDVDKEMIYWFYYNEEWKYFKTEIEFKSFIDGL